MLLLAARVVHGYFVDTSLFGYFGYLPKGCIAVMQKAAILAILVCAILAEIQYCNAIHGYQRIHVPPGWLPGAGAERFLHWARCAPAAARETLDRRALDL